MHTVSILLYQIVLLCGVTIDKISRNFEKVEDIRPSLEELCKIQWSAKELDDLYEEIRPDALIPESLPSMIAEREEIELQSRIENELYECALENEAAAKDAVKIYRKGIEYDLDFEYKKGEIRMGDLLRKTVSGGAQLHKALSSISQMMDSGDVSLKARFDSRDDSESASAYLAFRCTEQTLSILPRRLYLHFPALKTVSKLYGSEGNIGDSFMRYLETVVKETPEAEKYTETGIALERDVNNLSDYLKKYDCIKSSIMNWNISFLHEVQSDDGEDRLDKLLRFLSVQRGLENSVYGLWG